MQCSFNGTRIQRVLMPFCGIAESDIHSVSLILADIYMGPKSSSFGLSFIDGVKSGKVLDNESIMTQSRI